MISPQLYWVMTGDDFTLDINNPKEPKILVVGNNPDRQNIYSAALGLYNSRIVKLINKKGQLKSSVIIDELPTIYFRGLDNLIATARSNKVAVLLGFQDYSQLTRDYGDKESRVIQNTVGNVFSGQVVGETAKILSERFGKVLQKRQSMTINQREKSTSISTQMDSLIPASKISNLTQGMFVGAVADNFDERIEQKIFHAEIVIEGHVLLDEFADEREILDREARRKGQIGRSQDFTAWVCIAAAAVMMPVALGAGSQALTEQFLRVGAVALADRVALLERGKITAVGTHSELLENCDVYRQIAQSQLSEDELNGGKSGESKLPGETGKPIETGKPSVESELNESEGR